MNKLSLLIFSAFLAISCASSPTTNIANSWKSPTANTSSLESMKKIVIIALTTSDTQRRAMEDAFASHLQGVATPSYAYFKVPISQLNKETALTQLNADGYNGAFVIRLTNQTQSGSSRPTSVGLSPSLYWGFGSNLSAGLGLSIYPGYNNKKVEYTLESSLYQLPSETLIWSGTTIADNPNDLNTLSQQVANAVFAKMKSDGL